MKSSPRSRRPAVQITLGRAARLHRLVMLLAESPMGREAILADLGIGLRTFYRELELLKRCGVKIQQKNKLYTLLSTAAHAEGRLPFPDPQLSFAEMEELSRCPGEAGKRLATLLGSVVNKPAAKKKGIQEQKNDEELGAWANWARSHQGRREFPVDQTTMERTARSSMSPRTAVGWANRGVRDATECAFLREGGRDQ